VVLLPEADVDVVEVVETGIVEDRKLRKVEKPASFPRTKSYVSSASRYWLAVVEAVLCSWFDMITPPVKPIPNLP
jgi:hypothetical protein